MKRNNSGLWLSVFAGVLFTLALVVALNPVSGGGVIHLTDSILASDLNSTNSASDNFVVTYDEVTGGFTWETVILANVDGLSGLLADDQHVLDVEVLDIAIAKALMTTRGDIIYRNTTVPARLAKGSSGQVLTMGANEPGWATGGVSDPHGAAQHTDVTGELFLSAGEGYVNLGTVASQGDTFVTALGSANADQPRVYFSMKVPDDFVSFTKVEAIWTCNAASGNMYWELGAAYGASGENRSTHQDTPGLGTTATGGNSIFNVQEPANPLSLASLAPGDYLGLKFSRLGANASDTLEDAVYLIGLLFTYTAHQ